MSKAFDILSSALDEAIENSKAEEKFLKEDKKSIKRPLDFSKYRVGKEFDFPRNVDIYIRELRDNDRF